MTRYGALETEGVVETVERAGDAERAENVGNDERVEVCLHRNNMEKSVRGRKKGYEMFKMAKLLFCFVFFFLYDVNVC